MLFLVLSFRLSTWGISDELRDERTGRSGPNIASLGLVDHASRLGVFDDDLFPDQQKFIEDEYEFMHFIC
jgi:hypothetical protein